MNFACLFLSLAIFAIGFASKATPSCVTCDFPSITDETGLQGRVRFADFEYGKDEAGCRTVHYTCGDAYSPPRNFSRVEFSNDRKPHYERYVGSIEGSHHWIIRDSPKCNANGTWMFADREVTLANCRYQ